MSESTIRTFDVSTTANNKVNLEKLEIQLVASPDITTLLGVQMYASEIQVKFENGVTEAEIDAARLIVQAHDGVAGVASDDSGFINRRKAIRKLMDIGQYAGIPASALIGYRTTIDNEINGWVDSGNNTVLIAKIEADTADNGNDYHGFLNTVTSPGKTVRDFFVDYIQSI